MSLLASTHFTPVVGLDTHFTTLPPFNPFQPFIGLVFDPMDYIPFIGTNVYINGAKRAVSDTSGVLITMFHIPIASPFALAPIIGHESMNFFASQTVFADGTRLSPKGHMVMTCNDIGIPLSIQPGKNKPKKNFISLFAPTSFSASIPTGPPVFVGGPYIPDVAGIVQGMAMSYGFGAVLRKLGKTANKIANKIAKKQGKGSNKVSRWLCKLGFEPINLVTGAVTYEGLDFELHGVIPFTWERVWDSDSDFVGMLGHGVSCKYDRSVDIFEEEEVVGLRFDDGRMLSFPLLDRGESYYLRQEKTTLTRSPKGHFIAYDHTEEYYYHFEMQSVNFSETPRYQLSKIEDLRGFTIAFEYYFDKLVKIVDTAKRTLLLEYNAQGFVAKVNQETIIGEQTLVSYTYDTLGNMTGITDALEQTTVMEYQEHLMVKKTDRNGQTFYWEYEGSGIDAKCVHTWGDGGWQEGWMEYHPEEGYNKITDANRIDTYYYYTPEGLVTEIKNGEGDSSFTEYTKHKEVYREIDAEDNVTGYTYDDKGNQTSIVYPDGTISYFMYNDHGRLALVIDPEGNKRNYTYKKEHPHLINSIMEPDNSMTVLQYNDLQLVSEVRNGERKSTLTYDKAHNLNSLTDQDGEVTGWYYDHMGRVANTSTNGKVQESYSYDRLGRVTHIYTGEGGVTILKYNAYDEVIEAAGNHTSKVLFSYTPMGSLKMRQEQDTKVHFIYDKMEQLTSIKNEHGETYRFTRNKNGEIVKETGFDALTKVYRRDRAGKVIKVERPDNQFTEYEYDALGKIVRAEYSDGTWETFNYNKNGQLIDAHNQNCAVYLSRDAMGRVVEERQTTGIPSDQGYSITSEYTKNGYRSHIRSCLGAHIEHHYNLKGQCTSTHAQQGDSTQYQAQMQYSPLGQEIERLVSGGIRSKRSYNDFGMQATHQVQGRGRDYRNTRYSWTPSLQLNYILDIPQCIGTKFTYNELGSLASAQYWNNTYDYKLPDEVGNLYKTKEKDDRKYGAGGRLLEDKEWHYLYDKEGNLIKKTKNNSEAIIAAFKKEQQGKPPKKLYWIDRVFGYTGEPDEPDLAPKTDPEQWKYGEWQYTWQANGMLRSVKDPKGKVTAFEYDALGRRTVKINLAQKEIHRYIYDGNVLLHEFSYPLGDRPKAVADDIGRLFLEKKEDTSNLVTWVFDEGTFIPQAKIVGDKTYSIISDYLGTPILSFDQEGNKVWERELDIYGKPRRGDNTFIPFLYQGQYYDQETGLAYNRFRYYDPDTGTYISKDPIGLLGNNPNLYAYVHDSNGWIDPFGLDCAKFDKLVGSKKFKDHFIRHKKLIEEYTGKKYKWKTDQQEFLTDIKKLIDDDVFKHVGQGTLKKNQPIMEIFKSNKVTTAIKDLGDGVGEWATSIEKGKGMDLAIQFL